MEEVRVAADFFDPGAELSTFVVRAGEAGDAGAVASFTGVVRGNGGLRALEIEHYPGMTESAIAGMVADAAARFGLTAARVVHRHGVLRVGEPIMMVLAAAPHRAAALAAVEFLMDWLKSRAPFWKRELRDAGAAWVEARDADEAALARWQP